MSESRDHVAGITYMIGAVGCFVLMHAAMKTVALDYPPLQVACLRGLAALPLVMLWLLVRGRWRDVIDVTWNLQLGRGALTLFTGVMVAFALKVLPLADAYAVSFLGPLIVLACSPKLLCERVGARKWLAVIVAFVGALIVLRPTGAGLVTLGGLAMLASALSYALTVIATRKVMRTDSTAASVFWMTFVVGVGAGLLAIPVWIPVHPEHLGRFALIGTLGLAGQMTITESLRRAPASVVAPFDYTALAWAMTLDWAIWTVEPSSRMLIGAAIIVVSGLYLLHRERRTKEPGETG